MVSADMDRIAEICKEHNAILIEDAAESLGILQGDTPARLRLRSLRSMGTDHTTSGGGMLVPITRRGWRRSDSGRPRPETQQGTQHSELDTTTG